MAIQIQVSGLTPQQQQDVGDAFDKFLGRQAAGLTKAQWVERQLLIFMKNVVKTWKRQSHETDLATEAAQIDSDYQGV